VHPHEKKPYEKSGPHPTFPTNFMRKYEIGRKSPNQRFRPGIDKCTAGIAWGWGSGTVTGASSAGHLDPVENLKVYQHNKQET
jgi:hypothetical protein